MLAAIQNWAKMTFVLSLFVSLLVFQAQALDPTQPKGRSFGEFLKAQKIQLRGLQTEHRAELKVMKSSQKTELRAWKEKERQERVQYFETHAKGSDRRAYIKDFLKRRDEMKKKLAQDLAAKKSAYEARLRTMKKEQAERINLFRQAMKKGESPSEDLWPK